jgi:hypothetical protein
VVIDWLFQDWYPLGFLGLLVSSVAIGAWLSPRITSKELYRHTRASMVTPAPLTGHRSGEIATFSGILTGSGEGNNLAATTLVDHLRQESWCTDGLAIETAEGMVEFERAPRVLAGSKEIWRRRFVVRRHLSRGDRIIARGILHRRPGEAKGGYRDVTQQFVLEDGVLISATSPRAQGPGLRGPMALAVMGGGMVLIGILVFALRYQP